ncbi:MAG: polyphosphate polymerase domain-containing protein [Candidatus Pacebacteria bacterium]|jgi:hypothetical protein|nr:polyphosphate polymerase domain-containing protein [Candidatus Paceibacterota bacterium]MDP7466446.1 polyphosphate polymerase domain-containing protein [Candidatus Paceibacterota bacterium]|tara:strand:- start:2362 stop:3177 length:816 start_codon:yes stop_codon:yes gene_type:complete
MQQQKPKLHFQRLEFKYILDAKQFKEIKMLLRKYVNLDEFVNNTKHGFYEVLSLYYDSPKFYSYWEKIDGAKKRRKIRLRTYRTDGALSSNIFFEIKRKHDSIVLKDRFVLNGNDYENLINRGDFFNSDSMNDDNRSHLLEEFHFVKGLRSISPKILVSYNREPYLCKFNKNVRITFDYAIKAKRGEHLLHNENNFIDVSGTKVIMEIKFKGALPFYIENIIKRYNLSRVPYSKYCEGVEACYTLPLLHALGSNSQSDSLRLNKDRLLIND